MKQTHNSLFKIFIALAALFLISAQASAQTNPDTPPDHNTTNDSVLDKTVRQASQRVRIPFRRQRLSLSTFFATQTIAALRENTNANFNAQFHGVNLTYSRRYQIPKSQWLHVYSLGVMGGSAKGKVRALNVTNNLNDQPWYAATLTPGLAWRASMVSEVTLGVPIIYRSIQWRIAKGSGLTTENKDSYSAGMSLTYLNYFSHQTQIMVEVAHQLLWNSTSWAIGLAYNFN